MTSPLIRNLVEGHGIPVVDESTLPAFLAAHAHAVLFFTEDPGRYPESDDVAVILPELMAIFGDRCAAAVVARQAEKALQRRFGFSAWPALVLMRGDGYLGAVTRVQGWSDYLAAFEQLLGAEPARPPSIGIPVVGEGAGHCH